MDILALFFNTREDNLSDLETLYSYNNLFSIQTNPAKSVYCTFNSTDNGSITIRNQFIPPASDRKKQRLLVVYFNPSYGIKESSRHARETLCSLLNTMAHKTLGPACLRYLINSVITPAIAYQLLRAPNTLPPLKHLSTLMSSTVKKKICLLTDYLTAFHFLNTPLTPQLLSAHISGNAKAIYSQLFTLLNRTEI
jgi:hypothetical protein